MALLKKQKNDSFVCTEKADIIRMIKEYFEEAELKYKFDDDENLPTYITGSMGDDLPILAVIHIRDESLSFTCPLNLKANPDNYQKVIWELNKINKQLIYGAFYLDPEDGFIVYEYGFPYNEAKFTKDFFLGFLQMTVDTVDQFDGDLKQLAEKVNRPEYDMMYR